MTYLTYTEESKGTANMSNIEKFQFQNVPSAEEGGLVIDAEVRVVVVDGEPWFIAKDVLSVLGLSNVGEALTRVNEADISTTDVWSEANNRDYRMVTVNESGLYDLILDSRKPEAKAFRRWVTAEVLPTIRKTGAYVDPASDLAGRIAAGDTDAILEGLAVSLKIAEEARAKVAELTTKVAEDAPKVKLADRFVNENDEELYSLRDSARKLGVPPLTFNDTLRGWSWIDEKGTAAKAYAVSMGYAENRIYIHPGSGAATTQGRLTRKGLERAAIKLEKEGTWVGYAAAL